MFDTHSLSPHPMFELRIDPTTWALGASALGVAWLIATSFLRGVRSRERSPPGPPGLPIIGHLLMMPKEKEWLTYTKWAEQYGDIVALQLPGQTLVFLNAEEDAKQLFQGRGSNYSHRIAGPFIQLSGWLHGAATIQPGDEFRAQRRLVTKLIGPQVVKNTFGALTAATLGTIQRLVELKGETQSHFQLVTAQLLLGLAYGYEITDESDPLVTLAKECLHTFFEANRPDWVVNFIPILRYLPVWFPGAWFQRRALEIRATIRRAHDIPLNWVKDQIAAGTAQPSFAGDLLLDPESKLDETLLSNTVGDLYIAGSDTVIAASCWLMVALALHPEVQRRAQDELDRITGGERLPALDDRPQLPYLDCVIKEVYRWNAVTNFALPHVALNDDVYKGYTIKKGTILFANVYSMMHHRSKYPDPGAFRPERFMERPSEGGGRAEINEDPNHYAFGFGPRLCPGRFFADNFLFIFAAQLMATCNVSEAQYIDGTPITLENIDCTSGVISRPLPFTCAVNPRSTRAEGLLSG